MYVMKVYAFRRINDAVRGSVSLLAAFVGLRWEEEIDGGGSVIEVPLLYYYKSTLLL